MVDELRFEVASPCPMKWSAMAGDERRRFCGACRQHVFNLSGLTRDEVRALLADRDGKLCVRFFRREDGTVVTKDCATRFSEAFWERFGRTTRVGALALVSACFVALAFAVLIVVFGDNVRALFGQSTTGALAGDVAVTRKPSR